MSIKAIACFYLGMWAALAPAPPVAPETPAISPAVKVKVEEVWSLGGPDDDKLIMWVGLAVDDDGRLFVSDALDFSIKVFDSKGRVLLRAGRPGTGPGEFQAVRELAVSRDHVFVVDQQQPQVLVFDKQLRFERALPQTQPISCLRALPDGTLAAALVPVGRGKRPSIWLADNRGRTLQEIEFGSDAAHPAGDRASFVLSGRDAVLAYSFKNKVERLDRSGRVIWSKRLLNFPDARFKSIMGSKIPSEFIFKDIAVDKAGRLFVLGGGPTEHPSRDVYILSPAGDWIGTIVLPEPTHLLYLDSQDFLYSRANDGLTIKKYRILFPAEPEHKLLREPRP